jgi:hypothetical protein
MTGKMESSLSFPFFFDSSFRQFQSQFGTTAEDLERKLNQQKKEKSFLSLFCFNLSVSLSYSNILKIFSWCGWI